MKLLRMVVIGKNYKQIIPNCIINAGNILLQTNLFKNENNIPNTKNKIL